MGKGRQPTVSATVTYGLSCAQQPVILSKHKSDHVTAFHESSRRIPLHSGQIQTPFRNLRGPMRSGTWLPPWPSDHQWLHRPSFFPLLQHSRLILALGTSFSCPKDSSAWLTPSCLSLGLGRPSWLLQQLNAFSFTLCCYASNIWTSTYVTWYFLPPRTRALVCLIHGCISSDWTAWPTVALRENWVSACHDGAGPCHVLTGTQHRERSPTLTK